MLDIVDNLSEIIKQLWKKYRLQILIYLVASLLIAWGLKEGSRGLAFLLALPFGVIALYLAQRRTEALEKRNETDDKRLLNENFARSIELLGHQEASVRQGAIYALEKIAETYHSELTVVMDTLCAFIREKQSLEEEFLEEENNEDKEKRTCESIRKKIMEKIKSKGNNKNKEGDNEEEILKPKIDIEAAVGTIARLSQKLGELKIENIKEYDLSNIYLPIANFNDAKLLKFNLSDSCFYNCTFAGVDFSSANLTASDFRKSYFGGADFTETKIMKADFSEAKPKNCPPKNIDQAKSDEETKLPLEWEKSHNPEKSTQ